MKGPIQQETLVRLRSLVGGHDADVSDEGGVLHDSAMVGPPYDISADGQRFLMIKEGGADGTAAPLSIVVVQNWPEELKRLVPTK